MSALRHFLDAIKFEHTVFALPFAYLGMVLAARRLARLARRPLDHGGDGRGADAAMAANRLIDRRIDARTRGRQGATCRAGSCAARPGPRRGRLGRALLRRGVAARARSASRWPRSRSSFSSATPTRSASRGSPTGSSGSPTASPAAGAWIAVRGTMEPPAWLLWLAVTVWIAGFDLLYACQDVEFDRREGFTRSPRASGSRPRSGPRASATSSPSLALAAVGWTLGLGVLYWVGWSSWWAPRLRALAGVGERPLALDMAFFNVNGYISVITFVAAVAGLWY